MTLRLGEKLVLAGTGVIAAFAVLVGTLIYLKPPPVRYTYQESEESRSGEMIFRRESCMSCHEVFGNGAGIGPTLDGVGSRRDARWLARYLRDPKPGPTSDVETKPYRVAMPAYDALEAAELRALVSYLTALRQLDERGMAIEPRVR